MRKMRLKHHYTHYKGVIELEDGEEVIGIIETRSITTPYHIITMREEK